MCPHESKRRRLDDSRSSRRSELSVAARPHSAHAAESDRQCIGAHPAVAWAVGAQRVQQCKRVESLSAESAVLGSAFLDCDRLFRWQRGRITTLIQHSRASEQCTASVCCDRVNVVVWPGIESCSIDSTLRGPIRRPTENYPRLSCCHPVRRRRVDARGGSEYEPSQAGTVVAPSWRSGRAGTRRTSCTAPRPRPQSTAKGCTLRALYRWRRRPAQPAAAAVRLALQAEALARHLCQQPDGEG